ncbi:MAG: KEOPS complex N(6)-L-threonylcarbamoyladenine synthase Kae1, partial [Candidatus Nanoarchaeia archaeon]|nr:KEOPS complex N(6)-L-threonylcarbamoyladenine synthase Kae1 [Candidatus Nanoarchaeia archaeon]
MICLGIESTAHTFGASVVSAKGEILSDVRDMYTTENGGMNPTEVKLHHQAVAEKVVREAIEKSGVKKIDLVAVARAPGLAPCLLIGMKKAKEIAKDLGCPIIGVNHPIAHLSSGTWLTEAKDPIYLFVSGANTQIIALEGGRFRIFGETLDVGVGNALDKFARGLGLGFPGGPKVEELAKKGKWIEMPYTVKGMDTSFSGLVTNALTKFKKGASKEDLCFSFQEVAFSMLAEVTERAMAHCNKDNLVIIGGVAANKRLAHMLDTMCRARGAKFYAVPMKYSGDQGAMIAWQGLLEYQSGTRNNIEELDIDPLQRVDEVKVNWI